MDFLKISTFVIDKVIEGLFEENEKKKVSRAWSKDKEKDIGHYKKAGEGSAVIKS